MFEVIKQTMSNPFKPEIIDSTTIVLKQSKPFVQMSYKYEGDFSKLSDNEAIEKVLEDFHVEHYKDKIQEGKITELELELAKLKKDNKQKLNDISNQNNLMQQSLFEIVEMLLNKEDEENEEIEETEDGTDEGNDNVDGTSDTE